MFYQIRNVTYQEYVNMNLNVCKHLYRLDMLYDVLFTLYRFLFHWLKIVWTYAVISEYLNIMIFCCICKHIYLSSLKAMWSAKCLQFQLREDRPWERIDPQFVYVKVCVHRCDLTHSLTNIPVLEFSYLPHRLPWKPIKTNVCECVRACTYCLQVRTVFRKRGMVLTLNLVNLPQISLF